MDSSNEGSQHMYSLRNKKKYLSIILNTPLSGALSEVFVVISCSSGLCWSIFVFARAESYWEDQFYFHGF